MKEEELPDVTAELDARHLACPMPLLKTRQMLRRLSPGDVLHVMATDSGTRRDIPAYLGQAGHILVHQHDEDGVLHFWIRHGGSDG